MDYTKRVLRANGKTYKEGDWISLNGTTGRFYEGRIQTIEAELSGDFAKLMSMTDTPCAYASTHQCEYA
ncbi:MAG: hypothetical protein R2795_15230 [Saprospiraceae bacterium]